MKKYHSEHKYDIALTMPIYKIGKDRIRAYIQEIKDTFDGYSYQIVLSDNRPTYSRDCDLSEFDDDIVSHVDNGGNVYAFKARRSAFYASDAYYIWCLDDDNYIVPCKKDLLNKLLQKNEVIVSKHFNGSLGNCWIPSKKIQNFYNSITNERLPLTYFEDTLVRLFTTDYILEEKILWSNTLPNFKESIINNLSVDYYCPELLDIYKASSSLWEAKEIICINPTNFLWAVEAGIDFSNNLGLNIFYIRNFIKSHSEYFYIEDEFVLQRIFKMVEFSDYEKEQIINNQKKIGLLLEEQKRAPHTNKFSYDLAIGIPVYSVFRDRTVEEGIVRLKEYISEIKALFKKIKVQIIFSNNTNNDISELEQIPNVSVVNNGKNLYAFYARKSAFEHSDAAFFWTIDDDCSINPNVNTNIEDVILSNINNENCVIKKTFGIITFDIFTAPILKKIYDRVGKTTIRTYGEDVLPIYALTTINDREEIGNSFNFYNFSSHEYDKCNNVRMEDLILYLNEVVRIFPEFDNKWIIKHYLSHYNSSKEDKLELIKWIEKNYSNFIR